MTGAALVTGVLLLAVVAPPPRLPSGVGLVDVCRDALGGYTTGGFNDTPGGDESSDVDGGDVSGDVDGGDVSGDVGGGLSGGLSGDVGGGDVSGDVSGGVVGGDVDGGLSGDVGGGLSGDVDGGGVSGDVDGGLSGDVGGEVDGDVSDGAGIGPGDVAGVPMGNAAGEPGDGTVGTPSGGVSGEHSSDAEGDIGDHPGGDFGRMLDDIARSGRARGQLSFCSVTMVDPGWAPRPVPVEAGRPYFPSPGAPVPVRLMPGCGAVVGTTEGLELSAGFATLDGSRPADALFEYRLDGDTGSVFSRVPVEGPRAVLSFGTGELGPGESYRWRVRGTADDALAPTWSDWCTFEVAADAPDLRALDSGEREALLELGVRPERRYTVTLTAAQWRLVREPFEFDASDGVAMGEPSHDDLVRGQRLARLAAVIPRGGGRLTLTGAEWSTVAFEVAGWVEIVRFGNDEVEPEFWTDTDQYWRVVDRISRQLGGPAHPAFGIR
ncbi:hypothetical protein [Paractinoplanes brasiliensis]|uniref:hypothetical protein n=1 Tax=Paractinoplanes brasiliensis TaxID=52695 RepID=UPI00105F28F1|nr:hypothetical protein [Actinoplanes brasiliensis]